MKRLGGQKEDIKRMMCKCVWVYRGVGATYHTAKLPKVLSCGTPVPRISSLRESSCGKILRGFL